MNQNGEYFNQNWHFWAVLDKILTVFVLDQPLPGEVAAGIVERMVCRRKAMHITQAELSARSGVSLGSLKRFERTAQISLTSLINIAFALRCEEDFSELFSQVYYTSIDDAIKANKKRSAAKNKTNPGRV